MNLEKKEIKTKRSIRKHLYRFLIFIVCFLLVGFAYDKVGGYYDAKKYQPVGQMVDVNNHKMHVFSQGEGKDTVVFASGLLTRSPYADFYPLYNEISKYAKTVVYERPGYGWSEVTDVPRDIDSMVKEIHTALEKSGQKPPYIMVSHSLASLEVIRFAQIYKNEVSGIVMIDNGSPEFYATNQAMNPKFLYKTLKYTGIGRALINHTNIVKNSFKLLPNNVKQLGLAMTVKNLVPNRNVDDELNNRHNNAETVINNGHLGNLPIRILTSEENASNPTMQEALKAWSTDTTQSIVKGSRHYIHETTPEPINNEIIKLIKNQK